MNKTNRQSQEREREKSFIHSCQYKLTGTNGWQIDVKTANCDQWSTCKKTLSITLGGFNIVASGKDVTVNGNALNSTQGYVSGRKQKIKTISHDLCFFA